MKFRYILSAVLAASALFASCTQEMPGDLSVIQAEKSFISVPAAGGDASTTITATDTWKVEGVPDWLVVSPVSGGAGSTNVLFKAGSSASTRSAELKFIVGDKVQYVNVKQEVPVAEVKPSTCAEANAGQDGKIFRVEGVVVEIAESATYGNFYINDGTARLYVYGTKYQGQTKQGALIKLGIEVGDKVTVEGEKKTYNTTPELVDVDVLKVVKSLVKAEPENLSVEKEGGDVDVKVTYKGSNLDVIPQADWLSIASIEKVADTTVVKVRVAPNEGDTRNGAVVFKSSIPTQTSEVSVTITQATGMAMYTLPYAEDFAKGLGAWEVNVTTGRTDGKDIWTSAVYNNVPYAKASAGSKIDTKSMLVSPKISLKGAASPVLTFKHCGKFFGNQQEETTLWASKDNGATWTQLLFPEHDNAYGWKESGDISLASFAGAEYVNIAFQYVSNTEFYGTWEIADVKVEDRAAAITSIAGLNNAAAAAEVAYDITLTDAVVKYVSGNNAFVEDATGGIQIYKSGHGLVAGQKINGKVAAKVKLYSGYAEATAFDVTAATVTTDGSVEPVVLTLAQLQKSYLRYQNCMVKLEGVTLTSELNSSARDNKVQQGGAEIAGRLQDKNVTVAAGTGNLICFPTRYNATLQLGIWTPDHFTK